MLKHHHEIHHLYFNGNFSGRLESVVNDSKAGQMSKQTAGRLEQKHCTSLLDLCEEFLRLASLPIDHPMKPKY